MNYAVSVARYCLFFYLTPQKNVILNGPREYTQVVEADNIWQNAINIRYAIVSSRFVLDAHRPPAPRVTVGKSTI